MKSDETAIFEAYMASLPKTLVEEKAKKGLPPWLKKDGKKDDEDKEEGKKTDKKKKKNLPPWLKGKKKKVVKEDMDREVPELPEEIEGESDAGVGLVDFMGELREKDPELYQRLEDYMKENGMSDISSSEGEVEDSIESAPEAAPRNDSTSKYL